MKMPTPQNQILSQGFRWWPMILLLLILALLFCVNLALGSVRIPLGDVISTLFTGNASHATWTNIILKFRLPKAITAILAGAALSASGLQMQTLFRNPLADPSILGINAGASLGVAIVVLLVGTSGAKLLSGLGLMGDFGIAIAATFGAALVLMLILLIARRVDIMTLLILGLIVGYATNSLVSILLYFSIPEKIQAYISWTFGSFGGVTWDQLRVLTPAVLLGLLVAWFTTKPMNARSMGLSIQRTRFWLILSSSILSGAVTAFCGPIVFIGVAVPHLCRALFNTSDHRVLVPAVILMGGILTQAADLLAQLPGSEIVMPLNAITALLGAPVIIWVLLRSRGLRAMVSG
jgi:iron complex transport system permease protein